MVIGKQDVWLGGREKEARNERKRERYLSYVYVSVLSKREEFY